MAQGAIAFHKGDLVGSSPTLATRRLFMIAPYRKGHQSGNPKTQSKISRSQRRSQRQYLSNVIVNKTGKKKEKKPKERKPDRIVADTCNGGVTLGDYLQEIRIETVMNDMELAKQESIRQFVNRKQHAPARIDNSKLHAGSPMYFYCKYCDHMADVLPEDYLCRPRQECSQCLELVNQGWIDEAVKTACKTG